MINMVKREWLAILILISVVVVNTYVYLGRSDSLVWLNLIAAVIVGIFAIIVCAYELKVWLHKNSPHDVN